MSVHVGMGQVTHHLIQLQTSVDVCTMCVGVCGCVCVHVCMCMCTYVCMCMCICVYVHMCMCVCVCAWVM